MKKYDSRQYDIPLPKAVRKLSVLFGLVNADLFVVGGVVRDYMFSLASGKFDPKDIDLATSTKPEEVIKILTSSEAQGFGIKCYPKGESFGVISAIVDGQEYEIATFREEWYDPDNGDGRRPDEVKFSTPDKDAGRRDLTINALFYDLHSKEVRDYNLRADGVGQGIADICNGGVICPVGNARERFREDKLRILRLVRFACRFHDYVYVHNPEVMNAIDEFKDLSGVSSERIAAEFTMGLAKAKSSQTYVYSLEHLNLLSAIFPDLLVDTSGVKSRNIAPVLAWVLKDNGPNAVKKALNRLKYSNEVASRVEFLIEFYRTEAKNLVNLLKYRDLYKQLDPEISALVKAKLWEDVQEFAEYFLNYQPKAKFADFAHLKGAEISKAMAEYEIEEYNSGVI